MIRSNQSGKFINKFENFCCFTCEWNINGGFARKIEIGIHLPEEIAGYVYLDRSYSDGLLNAPTYISSIENPNLVRMKRKFEYSREDLEIEEW